MAKLFRLTDRFQRWRKKSTDRPKPPQGVLLLSCGGLGDTILFSHVVERFMAYAKPDEAITVLLRKDGAKTSFLFPDGVNTLVVDFAAFRKNLTYRMAISDQLFDANFRAVITTDYLRHPDLDEVMVQAAQCAEQIGMDVRPWSKYQSQLDAIAKTYSRLFDSGPARQDKLLRWNKFANWLTGEERPPGLRQVPAPNGRLDGPPLVLIQPFSAVKAKQYDVEIYQKLIQALPSDAVIKITGAPGEIDKNPAFLPLLEDDRVSYDDAGFADLLGLMQSARLIVSVDTAAMHLAAVAGAPTLCLASAAYVGEIVPYAPELAPDNVVFHYKTMSCEGCLGSCIHPFEGEKFRCVAEPAVEQIVDKALKLLHQ